MIGGGTTPPIVTMSEAQAYVRIETGEEEAVLAGLIRTASALCESFINQAVIAREFAVVVGASSSWQRLPVAPVRSVVSVETITVGGAAQAMEPGAYAIDIDSVGDGWVRTTGVHEGRLRVSGTAGIGASENDVPEPIRQGVLRLVAHMFNARDGGGGDPPAAVTALWRPYRRMRLS